MGEKEESNSITRPSADKTTPYLSSTPVSNTADERANECQETYALTIQHRGKNPETSCDRKEPEPKGIIIQNPESQRKENSAFPPETIQRYQRIRRNLQPLMRPHDILLTPDMYSLPNNAEIFPCHTRQTQAHFIYKMLDAFQHFLTSYKEGLGITVLASRGARQKLQEKEKCTRLVFLSYVSLHLEDWEDSL